MNTDWQNKYNSMKERNAHLFKSGIRSDCSFSVGVIAENQRLVHAHKFILATASPVFETMFFGSVPEKGDAPIILDDIDAEDFYDILFFIYNEEINIISYEKAQQVYCVADRFMLHHLMKICIGFLECNVTPENVFKNIDFAEQFDLLNLKDLCVQVVKTKTSEIINSPSFLQVNISFLNTIMSQDNLNISSELDLFHALERYAKFHFTIDERRKPFSANYKDTTNMNLPKNAEFKLIFKENNDSLDETNAESVEYNANRKEEERSLKDAEDFLKLYKRLRFLTLNPEEFARGPAMSKLLNADDALAISVCLIEPQYVKIYFPKKFSDSTEPRFTYKEQVDMSNSTSLRQLYCDNCRTYTVCSGCR